VAIYILPQIHSWWWLIGRKWQIMDRKMTHNENIHADPMTFNPARFLGSDPEADLVDLVFG